MGNFELDQVSFKRYDSFYFCVLIFAEFLNHLG